MVVCREYCHRFHRISSFWGKLMICRTWPALGWHLVDYPNVQCPVSVGGRHTLTIRAKYNGRDVFIQMGTSMPILAIATLHVRHAQGTIVSITVKIGRHIRHSMLGA